MKIDPLVVAQVSAVLFVIAAAIAAVALILRSSSGGADPRSLCEDCGAPMHPHVEHAHYFKCANGHVWTEGSGHLVRTLRRVPDLDSRTPDWSPAS